MFRTWMQVSEDIAALAAGQKNPFYRRVTGSYPFQTHEIFATADEVEELYDWATATAEHISCPTI